MLNEKRLAMIRRLGRKDSKYKDFLRSLSWIELQEHSKQREYAAGPWILVDDEPPANCRILAKFENGSVAVVCQDAFGQSWLCGKFYDFLIEKYAHINMPEED